MDMVSDLGNDLAVAMLIEKKHANKIESKDIAPLINRIREVLKPISDRDHAYSTQLPLTPNSSASNWS